MCALSRCSLAAVVLVTAMAGCASERSEPPNPPESRAAEGEPSTALSERGFRQHTDLLARCRLSVPARDFAIEARHFDAAAPLHKIRHQLTLSVAQRRVVRIDIWDDPQQRELSAWARQHLGFLLDGAATVEARAMTPAALEALVLEHPRSTQAPARTTALLRADGRIFRVTCLHTDEADAQAICQRVLDELETEAKP